MLFGSAITWLKIIQTLQVGGVLESLMMGTEVFKIDAPWAEKLRKTRVSFLMNPSV